MRESQPTRRTQQHPARTETTGRTEKADCFNCAASGRTCDRARHRCGTCAANVQLCQGYPRNLQWQVGVASRGRMKAKGFAPPAETAGSPPASKSLRFKESRPPRKRNHVVWNSRPSYSQKVQSDLLRPSSGQADRDSRGGSRDGQEDARDDSQQESQDARQAGTPQGEQTDTRQAICADESIGCSAVLPLNGTSCPDEGSEQVLDVGRSPLPSATVPSDGVHFNSPMYLGDMIDFPNMLDLPPVDPSLDLTVPWDIFDADAPVQEDDMIMPIEDIFSTSLSPAPLELQNLLSMYDGELCWMPITFDIDANPFRCRQATTSSAPRYLLHAILAYTLQHVSCTNDTPPDGALVHKATSFKTSAITLYNSALERERDRPAVDVLDTTLVLYTLELLLYGIGPWRTYLARSLQIIESAGGIQAMENSPRMQAQLAMFSWWDCTLALLSRSECVFPHCYYDFIVGDQSKDDGWDMFSLSGVPKELFRHLVEIVQLAFEKEQTTRMRWATFNTERVLEVERSIREYTPQGSRRLCLTDEDDEEAVQSWHDCRSAVDAWKHALLLYIARVFKWDRKAGERRPAGLLSLARLTLDSVRCCRSTLLVQKQLLLPVFLAGSESNDAYSRRYAQEYCEGWFHRCRYRMFQDASALLQDIWQERDRRDGDMSVWWGSVLDAKTTEMRRVAPDASDYLFG